MQVNQKFKAIYFPDFKERDTKSKSFTLAFSTNDTDLLNAVRHLSSHEIREKLGISTFGDLEDKAQTEGLPINRYCLWSLKKEIGERKDEKLNPIHTTFQSSKQSPLQSWFPYLEGYAPEFVRHIIDKYVPEGAEVIYDPFSGTGTTPLVATASGYTAYYSEVNPLLQFLTQVKAKARNVKSRGKLIASLERLAINLRKNIENELEDEDLRASYFNTFGESKFFPNEIFSLILKTKSYIKNLYFEDILLSELVTVAILPVLIDVSHLKRQGDLRFKRENEREIITTNDYHRLLVERLENIIQDLKVIEPTDIPVLITEDAKEVGKLPKIGIDAVITSPPYLNGTNYFRNTKVELWFLGFLKSGADLSNFRRLAVTAGINDVSLSIEKDFKNAKLTRLLNKLEKVAYDKRIPKMVHDYFADMYTIFNGLRSQLNKDAVLAIDLGDSIYSGVHVKTDDILVSVLENLGYELQETVVLRKRNSNNGQELKQVLLIFKMSSGLIISKKSDFHWEKNWREFKDKQPHRFGELAKRNWGDVNHSLCSYQGKLKPSIANQLVSTFVPDKGSVLDIFAGVGTIPLEAALQEKISFSFEISPAALLISKAKLKKINDKRIEKTLVDLESWIKEYRIPSKVLNDAKSFGLNKTLEDYFHPSTLKEVVAAREYFRKNYDGSAEMALVISAIMHILHGNRPYALSRRSHGITPFAPTGDFIYKSLIEKTREKISRVMSGGKREIFQSGHVYYQDTTKVWPAEIQNLDAIITSPPFFDSTRFYSANWMRLWFAGWDENNFKTEPINFIDELQKKDLSVYDRIFMQARGRLKTGGVLVLHLGKSHKCDMAKELAERASKWFNVYDIFEESVENGESHGIRDRGSVKAHQYLILV